MVPKITKRHSYPRRVYDKGPYHRRSYVKILGASYETLSNDLHLLAHICNMIENLQRSDLSPKLNKKDIFLEIVKQLFPTLSTDNLMFLDTFVDFICSNGLVNRVSYFSNAYNAIKKNLSGN